MKLSHEMVQRQVVAIGAEAADHSQGQVGEVGLMPEGFAAVDIADVDFNKGQRYGCQCISQGDAGVGKGGWVDDKTSHLGIRCPVDQVDQGPFVIALVALNVKALGLTSGGEGLVDLFEGG